MALNTRRPSRLWGWQFARGGPTRVTTTKFISRMRLCCELFCSRPHRTFWKQTMQCMGNALSALINGWTDKTSIHRQTAAAAFYIPIPRISPEILILGRKFFKCPNIECCCPFCSFSLGTRKWPTGEVLVQASVGYIWQNISIVLIGTERGSKTTVTGS